MNHARFSSVDIQKSNQNTQRRMSDVTPKVARGVLSHQETRLAYVQSRQQARASQQRIVQLGTLQSSDDVPYFRRSLYAPAVVPQKRSIVRPVIAPVLKRPTLMTARLATPLSFISPTSTVIRPATPLSAARPIATFARPVAVVPSQLTPLEKLRNMQSRKFAPQKPREKESFFKKAASIKTRKPLKNIFQGFSQTFALLFQKKFAYMAVSLVLFVFLSSGAFSLVDKGMKLKGQVLGVSQDGFMSLNDAATNIKDRRFNQSATDFESAAQSFEDASKSFDEWSTTIVDVSQFFPVISKLSSGKNAMEAGKHLALAGKSINGALSVLATVKNPLDATGNVSLLEVFQTTEKSISQTKDELILAQDALDKVKVDDLPEDKREKFVKVKTQLPNMIVMMNNFSDSNQILSDLLGGNGPRKYLFLFQNNHEMRATGGFIGSYGLMDIANGRIRNFFVDGIFNPDGQFKENIVPPKPIQKMSAAWSLHDSNWFPDFPTSAEKAISFYEKTGGPTVDGVITLTPTVMQKLLRVTGPVYMADYNKTLTADNFIEEVQQEVEVDYDKTKNKPKQILAELAPILLDKLFNVTDAKQAIATAQAFESGLGEKHILLYSRNADVEKIIDDAGWSGKILESQGDYLSVINTNINGYKTDGVVDESIDHKASIQNDGSVIDTVTVTRKHNGGHTDKDWWNRVNADYMRVYVPQGSKLISAEGQTHEVVDAPLDYDKLGFRHDKEIDQQESSITVDPSTGTQMYDDDGKTVFANWVYVSPQETVTITYSYLLPFKVQPDLQSKEGFDSYSLTLQKQSGSVGSKLNASVEFPSSMRSVWQSSDNLLPYYGGLRFESDLTRDRFVGVVFGK